MPLVTSISLKKWCSLIGAHLIWAQTSFLWVYGNLYAYLDSYFEISCSPGCTDADSQWIISLYMSFVSFGAFAMDPLERKIGAKACGMVSSLLSCSVLFGMAWMVKISILGTALLAGLVFSPSVGLTMSVSAHYIHKWAPKQSSVLMGTSTSFAAILAILQNQFITLYVNPDNLEPDFILGKKTYFSQQELLSRVPRALIIFAAMTLVLQLIGNLMLFSPPEIEQSTQLESPARHVSETTTPTQSPVHSCRINEAFDDSLEPPSNGAPIFILQNELNPAAILPEGFSITSSTTANEQPPLDALSKSVAETDKHCKTNDSEQETNNRDQRSENPSKFVICRTALDIDVSYDRSDCVKNNLADYKSNTRKNLRPIKVTDPNANKAKESPKRKGDTKLWTPREVLKTLAFWSTWLAATSLTHGLIVINNYYKKFGLLFIQDDKFLTAIGSTIPVVSSTSKVVFGILLDRTILSVQDVLVVSQALQAILLAFVYLAPQINRYLYMLVVLSLAVPQSNFYIIQPTAARKLFGKDYFITNFAMFLTSFLVSGFSTANMVDPVVDNLGWIWLFMFLAFISLLVLVLTATSNFRVKRPASL